MIDKEEQSKPMEKRPSATNRLVHGSATIVIPAYNSERTIARVIESCLNQTVKGEVIVVDDGSDDSTAEIVKRYPVKYIYQENSGPAKARNTGWENANGEIILFTDSDCIPEKDWVGKMLGYHSRDNIYVVGGSYDITNPESLLARCIHQEILERHRKMSGEVDYLGSFNLSYRRKILEELGGFNEEFRYASGEDNDLSYRVRKKGYKLIFDREIKVAHNHQTKFFKYLKEQFRHGFWRMKLYRLHPDMAKGDSYAGIFDFIQPPLAMVILIGAFSSIFSELLLKITGGLALLLVGLQLPITFSVIKREKQISYLFFIPMLFFRTFARGLGMLQGFLDFFLLKGSKK
ncbi:MAG: glycosyltransferase [Nitrospirota bacterium]